MPVDIADLEVFEGPSEGAFVGGHGELSFTLRVAVGS
jgi:hypothetical protein